MQFILVLGFWFSGFGFSPFALQVSLTEMVTDEKP